MIINKDNPFTPLSKPIHIKLDLTPALIQTDDPKDELNKVRIIVTDSHYYIFTSGPTLHEQGPLESFQLEGRGIYNLNNQYTVQRSKGCDCGTSLKGFHPFLGVPYAPLT